MKSQQEEDITKLPLLTSYQMYRRELAQLPRLTQEQERNLELRAQSGDQKSKQRLVLNCLNYVARIAWRYIDYLDHDEYLDLVGIGNAALMRYLEKSLSKNKPSAYLRACAKWEIIHHCYYHSKLMRRQLSQKKLPRISVLSNLDIFSEEYDTRRLQ